MRGPAPTLVRVFRGFARSRWRLLQAARGVLVDETGEPLQASARAPEGASNVPARRRFVPADARCAPAPALGPLPELSRAVERSLLLSLRGECDTLVRTQSIFQRLLVGLHPTLVDAA